MNIGYAKGARVLLALLMVLGLAACGDTEQQVQTLNPVAFHSDDDAMCAT
jgi:uncharacterized lipoprotein YehR (DUF1307 family)